MVKFRIGDTVIVTSTTVFAPLLIFRGIIVGVSEYGVGEHSASVYGKKNGSKNVSYQFFGSNSLSICRVVLMEKHLKIRPGR